MANACKGCGTEENTSVILIMNTETIYACPYCKPILLKGIEEILRKPIRPTAADWIKKPSNTRNVRASTSKENKWSSFHENYLAWQERINKRRMTYEEQRDTFLHKFIMYSTEEHESKHQYFSFNESLPNIFYVADIICGDADDIWKKVCCMFPGIVVKGSSTFSVIYPIFNTKSWSDKYKYNYTTGCEDLHREHIDCIVSKQRVIEELRKQTGYETLITELEKDSWEQGIINDVANKEDELRRGRYHYEVIKYVAEELRMLPKTQYIMGKGYINDYSKVHKYDDIINKALDDNLSIMECAKLVENKIAVDEMPDDYG